MQKKIFIFIGKSGCGKGTQAKFLIEKLKEKKEEAYYVATGDEFRKVINQDTYTSGLIKNIVESGSFCPSFTAVMMWATALQRDLKENEHIIIDGTPRSLSESAVLDTLFDFYNVTPVVVYIDVGEEWAINRLLQRGRKDDTPEGSKSRMVLFTNDIVPILEQYKKRFEYSFYTINGEQSIEDVTKEMFEKLGLDK